MAERYVRRQYFVKQSLQTRYAFMFVLSIGIGLNIGVILTLLAPLLQANSPSFPLLFFILVFSFIILVAAISVLFTHKIAGPLYKIEKIFREIQDDKDLSLRIHLRSGDELQELASEINTLLDDLRVSMVVDIQKRKALMAHIDTLIQTFREDGQEESPNHQAILQQLFSIRQQLQDIKPGYKI